ncbi:MAG: protein arginine kinase [Planctomycetota bacterium]
MDLNKLARHAGEWLRGSGSDADIVVACRIRLARNVSDVPFVSRCTPEQRAELARTLSEKVIDAGIGEGGQYLSLEDLPEIDRLFLVERHLISKEHAESDGPRGVAFDVRETVSVMVNEEDHLRIQAFKSGFHIEDTWAGIDQLDNRISDRVEYAFSDQLGYLAACPTNVGTGMRASVMLHLPALGITKQIEQVVHAVQKMGLTVRGLYGEGTQASGALYQVSNQMTLGKSEVEIVENLASTVPTIVTMERKARQALMEQQRERLEDKVWRAFGVLRSARAISSDETIDHLSQMRLGVNLGLLDKLDMGTINQLFILTLPAHLQKIEGRRLEPNQRDVFRASFIRETLGES